MRIKKKKKIHQANRWKIMLEHIQLVNIETIHNIQLVNIETIHIS